MFTELVVAAEYNAGHIRFTAWFCDGRKSAFAHYNPTKCTIVGLSRLTDCCMLLSMMVDIDAPHNAVTRKVAGD